MTVLPYVKFRFIRFVHQNAKESLFQILNIKFAFISIPIVADNLLTKEDNYKEEVEIGETIVGCLSRNINIKEEFNDGDIALITNTIQLKNLTRQYQ